MIAHETPMSGAAADFAARLCAHLPVIETSRLRLRAPEVGDFDAWAEILCGPAAPYLGGPFTRDEAFVEFLSSVGLWLLRGHGLWTVEGREEPGIVGFVLIGFEPGDLEPELGYLFLPSAEGRGLAFEAAAAVRDHALALGLPSLVSYVAAENARSVALAERLGARRDGVVQGSDVFRYWKTGGRGMEVDFKTPERGA